MKKILSILLILSAAIGAFAFPSVLSDTNGNILFPTNLNFPQATWQQITNVIRNVASTNGGGTGGTNGGIPILGSANITVTPTGGSNQISVTSGSFDLAGTAQLATNGLQSGAFNPTNNYDLAGRAQAATNGLQSGAFNSTNKFDLAGTGLAAAAAATNNLGTSAFMPASAYDAAGAAITAGTAAQVSATNVAGQSTATLSNLVTGANGSVSGAGLTNVNGSMVFGVMTNSTAGVAASSLASFFQTYSAWTTANFCTNTFTDPVFGSYTINGPMSVGFDGTNFTVLACHDFNFSTGIFLFRGPALNNIALTNYGIVIAPRNVAGQTNFIAPGGIYTENGTNYIPLNGSFYVPDYSGPVYLAQAPAGTTNWTVYTTNGVWCPILQHDSNPWDQSGLYRGSFAKQNGLYYLYLNGNPTNGSPLGEQMGFATATNLLGPWSMYAGNPLFPGGDAQLFNWSGAWVMSYSVSAQPGLWMAYSLNLTNWTQSDYNALAPTVGTEDVRWCLASSNGTYYAVSDSNGGGANQVHAPLNPFHALVSVLANGTNLNGTFIGNGAQLTALNAGALTGAVPISTLPSNVAITGYDTNQDWTITNAEIPWVNLELYLSLGQSTNGMIVYTNTATNGIVIYGVYNDPYETTDAGARAWTIQTNLPDSSAHQALFGNFNADSDASGNFPQLIGAGIWEIYPDTTGNGSAMQVLAPSLLVAGYLAGSGAAVSNLNASALTSGTVPANVLGIAVTNGSIATNALGIADTVGYSSDVATAPGDLVTGQASAATAANVFSAGYENSGFIGAGDGAGPMQLLGANNVCTNDNVVMIGDGYPHGPNSPFDGMISWTNKSFLVGFNGGIWFYGPMFYWNGAMILTNGSPLTAANLSGQLLPGNLGPLSLTNLPAGTLTNGSALPASSLTGLVPATALVNGTNQLVSVLWTNSAVLITLGTNALGGVTEYMATNQLPLGAGGGGSSTPLFATNIVQTSNGVPTAFVGTNGSAWFTNSMIVNGGVTAAGGFITSSNFSENNSLGSFYVNNGVGNIQLNAPGGTGNTAFEVSENGVTLIGANKYGQSLVLAVNPGSSININSPVAALNVLGASTAASVNATNGYAMGTQSGVNGLYTLFTNSAGTHGWYEYIGGGIITNMTSF